LSNRLNIIIVKLNFRPKDNALTVILNVFLTLADEKIFLLYYFYSHGLCNHRHNNNSPILQSAFLFSTTGSCDLFAIKSAAMFSFRSTVPMLGYVMTSI